MIVTLTSSGSKLEDPDISSMSTNEKALFQLHSYHGKVLADESIPLSLCEKNAEYNLISQMADDRFRMCRGIEDISGVKFAQFIKSCDLQMLGKIRSVLLIEQFMGEVVGVQFSANFEKAFAPRLPASHQKQRPPPPLQAPPGVPPAPPVVK